MPLTEFLRMSKGKADATLQRASSSTDPSCRPDATDCVELVWENGQIMMQDQSTRIRKNPFANNFQSFVPRTQDVRSSGGSKMTKFSTVDSAMADFPLPDSSNDMGLDQDADLVPWLNYPIEDPMHNDYTSDFLNELSGVTINDLSTENQLAFRGKKSCLHGDGIRNTNVVDDSVNMKHGNPTKGAPVSEKHTRGGSREVLQFSQPFEHIAPRSEACDASGNTSDSHHVTSRDNSLCAFTNLRLQKLNAGHPSTSSNFTNFSYFARPTTLGRGNISNKLDNDGKRSMLSTSNNAESAIGNFSTGCSQKETFARDQSVHATIAVNSDSLPTKPAEELLSSNQAVCQEDNPRNDASPSHAHGATLGKTGVVGEINLEPVVTTSSVCSGNSVERASSDHARDLKRKSRETVESEGPSEELEDESVGVRKTASARTGSKRSRAAEVHNLSERRRRDRINEKMRALQELIPNCNKVDKASMLDEAIEYLKTLQLQVQMLSMGAGLYMHPMMLPPGMPPMQGVHMPQFSPMGVGMGMGLGMGYGMNMLDMSSGMKMMPFQGPHYPLPSGAPFQGMPGSNLQAFGHPSQGVPMPIQRAPVLPASSVLPMKIPIGPNVLGVGGSTDAPHLVPSCSSKNVGSQVMPGHNVSGSVTMNQTSIQATNEGTKCAAAPHDQHQPVNASEVVATNKSDPKLSGD